MRMPWIGMTSVSAASVSIWPVMMLRKSTRPLALRRRDISIPSLAIEAALLHLVGRRSAGR